MFRQEWVERIGPGFELVLTPSKVRLSFLIQLEVALYAVHGDCEDVHEAEVLGVLREYGCEPA